MTFVFPEGLAPDVFPLAWLVGKWRGLGEISYHEEVPTQRIVSEITFDHDGGPYLRYESKIRVLGAGPAEIPGPVLPTESADSEEVQALLAGADTTVMASAGDDSGVSTGSTTRVDPGDVSAPNPAPEPTEEEIDDAIGTASGEDACGTASGDSDDDAPVYSAETGYWRVSALRDGSLANNEFPLEVFIADSAGRLTFFNGFASPARVELASAKVIRSATADEINGSKRMYGFVGGQLAWAEDLVAYGHDLGSYASALLSRIDDHPEEAA